MSCRIDRYTTDMRREDVDKSFTSAMKMWSDAAPLNFIRVYHNPADIVLSFARRSKSEHNCKFVSKSWSKTVGHKLANMYLESKLMHRSVKTTYIDPR